MPDARTSSNAMQVKGLISQAVYMATDLTSSMQCRTEDSTVRNHSRQLGVVAVPVDVYTTSSTIYILISIGFRLNNEQ